MDVAVAVPVAEVEDESSSPPLWVFVVSAGRMRAPPNLQAQHCAYPSVLLFESGVQLTITEALPLHNIDARHLQKRTGGKDCVWSGFEGV